MRAAAAGSLLISLHDVSPLTLPACEQAMGLLREVEISPAALTVLAIPHHEERIPLDQHPPTLRFLRDLEQQGACIVMHGLTHKMQGRRWSPAGLAKAHLFARGQGELYATDEADTARRLDEGQAILQRAGLPAAAGAFVPPAWLLSRAARQVVAARGFAFYELFGGIVADRGVHAPRVVGWGSLNGLEAAATALYADLQSRTARHDTRLAIHPADMMRPAQKAAVRRVVSRLSALMQTFSYQAYLTRVKVN